MHTHAPSPCPGHRRLGAQPPPNASPALPPPRQADKRLKAFSFFGGNKYEDAAEMYEKAANQFKLAKACEKEGPSFWCPPFSFST